MIIFAALKSRADQITIFELSQAIEQKKKKKSFVQLRLSGVVFFCDFRAV